MLSWKYNVIIFVGVSVSVFIFLSIETWFQYRQEKKMQMERDRAKGKLSDKKALKAPKVYKLKMRCPNCNTRLKGAKSNMIGEIGVCQKCKAEFQIQEK